MAVQERRYDASRGLSLLVEDWVSRANALQRKGRAGRVRPGKCFSLYTRDRYERRLRPFQVFLSHDCCLVHNCLHFILAASRWRNLVYYFHPCCREAGQALQAKVSGGL